MKAAEREVYQALVNEVDYSLCIICKYAEFLGCEEEPECKHPLADKSCAFEKQMERAGNLGDCWGFRPSHPVSLIADFIGIILRNGWDTIAWWQVKRGKQKGQWKIAGSKEMI